MKDKIVHIVCFDVPYPVDHGGFFDLFYKIKALKEQGNSIILHCFEYGRSQQKILNTLCKEVLYYPRNTGWKGFSFNLPYIVASRKSNLLLKNLSTDNHPIILEGTHTTYLLYKNQFPSRKVIYRLHNIEHIYYRQLYVSENSFFKKLYYLLESLLLKRYEKKAAMNASMVLAVSEMDVDQFKRYCPSANIQYLPVFLPYQHVQIKEGAGNYCLYHGNLSVAENEKAATWLIENVFRDISIPLKIAGRKPSKKLTNLIQQYKNINLIADPSHNEMQRLIQEAHINIILSLNATGIKLKLINALFHGRHCLVNMAAIKNTGLEKYCQLAESASQFQKEILRLQSIEFEKEEILQRETILYIIFNNATNAQKLNELLY
jgi:hypothetical protein